MGLVALQWFKQPIWRKRLEEYLAQRKCWLFFPAVFSLLYPLLSSVSNSPFLSFLPSLSLFLSWFSCEADIIRFITQNVTSFVLNLKSGKGKVPHQNGPFHCFFLVVYGPQVRFSHGRVAPNRKPVSHPWPLFSWPHHEVSIGFFWTLVLLRLDLTWCGQVHKDPLGPW